MQPHKQKPQKILYCQCGMIFHPAYRNDATLILTIPSCDVNFLWISFMIMGILPSKESHLSLVIKAI